MSSVTVRIDEKSREVLKKLAEFSGESMQAVLTRAIEEHRRRVFLERINQGYTAMKNDPASQAAMRKELESWDATLLDGLEPSQPRSKKRRK